MSPSARIHHLGLREMHGSMVPQGSIIERWDANISAWVYVSCCHPSDADQVAALHGITAQTSPPPPMKLLQQGDIIDLGEGHSVYADIPEHFAYANRRGSFALTHAKADIGGELAYLKGRYRVYKVTLDGGGTGHGRNDVYPDGHHVFAKRADGVLVDFYQTGWFTATIYEIQTVGFSDC